MSKEWYNPIKVDGQPDLFKSFTWDMYDYRIKPGPEREFIDLGLPSGTLWAIKNEEGFYTFDDAKEKFGENMPLKEDGEELFRECFHRWDDERNGIEILSPFNGNRLFLPAVGYQNYSSRNLYCTNSYGNYWYGSLNSATNGNSLSFSNTSLYMSGSNNRAYGFSVRCVKHK